MNQEVNRRSMCNIVDCTNCLFCCLFRAVFRLRSVQSTALWHCGQVIIRRIRGTDTLIAIGTADVACDRRVVPRAGDLVIALTVISKARKCRECRLICLGHVYSCQEGVRRSQSRRGPPRPTAPRARAAGRSGRHTATDGGRGGGCRRSGRQKT